ncbi:MAG TPA: endonuclease, partial [Porphyromonadaceae bacterium]|nr:endonuclease [Porphyromonadaceae bacterium]
QVFASAQTAVQADLNVASFNIRMDTPNDSLDSWEHRKDMVNGLIRFHDFDVFGIQEGFHHQIIDILKPGGYDYVGVGRDDGKETGEHSAIIYKKDRFKVLENGDFWLSETPDIPGIGWDAICCNRICSWAKFKDNESGKEFYFFNVHYDHEGVEARRQSSLLLMKKIREIAADYPVIATGDFNAVPDSEPIQIIMNDGLLNDSYLVSHTPPYGTVGTYNSFNVNAPVGNRIDYVWVTKDIMVNKYGVLNELRYGRFPSDHFPVMVNVSF